jgi:peptidoglycan/LPS O-acetylase OafA/YrhL
LLLTGKYPLVTWAAPLLVGLWIGRRNLATPAVRWWLLILGLAIAVAAALASDWLTETLGGPFEGLHDPRFAVLLTDEPHSEMPLWMLGSIGSACAVLGGMLLLADRLPRATWPLVATGQLALTVYVGHLLLLDAFPELLKRDTVPEAFLTVGAFMLLAVAASTLWRAVLPRGPLEAALAAPWWIVERIAQPIVRRLTTGRRAR